MRGCDLETRRVASRPLTEAQVRANGEIEWKRRWYY